jgi:hypothetical protein
MKSLQASHQQKYGQQQLDIGERRLAIEEEAEKNRQKAQMWSGIGSIVGTAAGFIPVVGPLVSGAIGATTRMAAPFKSTPEMQYGTDSEWPSEVRFMNMGSQYLFGSGGK